MAQNLFRTLQYKDSKLLYLLKTNQLWELRKLSFKEMEDVERGDFFYPAGTAPDLALALYTVLQDVH